MITCESRASGGYASLVPKHVFWMTDMPMQGLQGLPSILVQYAKSLRAFGAQNK